MSSSESALPESSLLSIREAADRLGCSTANLYALIEAGDIPVIRVGRRKGYRIDPADIREFLRIRKLTRSQSSPQRPPPRCRLKHIRLDRHGK